MGSWPNTLQGGRGETELDGLRVYYNHLRPHEALEDRTPGEAAGIIIEGKDKWKTMIQAAAKRRSLEVSVHHI